MAVVIHLLLAGMLGDPVGLFWPLLGSHFARLPEGVSLIGRVLPLSAGEILKEVLGIAALVWPKPTLLAVGYNLIRDWAWVKVSEPV